MTPTHVVQFTRKPYPGAFSIERVFDDVTANLPADVAVTRVENSAYSSGLWPRLRDAMRAWRRRGPVNHVLGDVHYLTFFLPKARTILTIHDCEMIERAQGLKRRALKLLWLDLPLRRAGHVVAISEQTKASILALSGVAPDRIQVIDNPVSDRFQSAPRPAPGRNARPTILHIGTKPNKNLERLIPALAGLPVTLLVVGPLSDRQRALLEGADLEFRALSNLSDDALRACYLEADLLAFVSLSEGFGLPILEAQATGRPVITADCAPMTRVAGPGGAVFVDPEDVGAIRAAVTRVLGDAVLQADLVQAGQANVTRFHPKSVAAQYAALYRRVAGC